MLHYVFIYTWTLTETFTMPFCAACPLIIIIIIVILISLSVKWCVTVDGMRRCFICWQKEQQCVTAVFVLWICRGCISPVMHNISFFSFFWWYYRLWFCLTFPCTSSLFVFYGGRWITATSLPKLCTALTEHIIQKRKPMCAPVFKPKHKSEVEEQRERDRKATYLSTGIHWQCSKGKHSLWFLPHSTFCNPRDVNNLVLQ